MSARRSQRSAQTGFSLIELLVAMALAIVVMAGVINSFLASKEAFRLNEELAFIQENARFATEYVGRAVREAGYFGCDNRNAVTVNTVQGAAAGFIESTGIRGHEAGGVFPSEFNDALAGTDALVIRRADSGNAFPVDTHDAASAQLTVVGTHSFDPGTILVISDRDCRHQGIFVMSGPAGGSAQQFEHDISSTPSGSPRNCTKNISAQGSSGDQFQCGDVWTVADPYAEDSLVMAMKAEAFFLAPSSIDATLPALYSEAIGNGGGAVRNELVAGIENLQLTYGVDTDADGAANRFLRADQVSAAQWNSVVSVRLEMVFRSRNPVLAEPTARSLLGVNYNDRFMRQLVTSTFRVRNYLG